MLQRALVGARLRLRDDSGGGGGEDVWTRPLERHKPAVGFTHRVTGGVAIEVRTLRSGRSCRHWSGEWECDGGVERTDHALQ